MKETVIVFKDKKSREIKTFVNLDGHGARVDLADFVKMLADFYGSPATTLTRKRLLEGLEAASAQAVRQMKSVTREVAAATLERR